MAFCPERLSNSEEQTLNAFFGDLYERKLCFQIREEEECDIRDAVIEMVDIIAEEIGDFEPKFKISRKILVGSAGERMQIVQPVDYDFLLVLEELSCETGSPTYSIKPCPEKKGCVHIRMEKHDLKQSWMPQIYGGELKSTRGERKSSDPDGIRQYFHKAIQEAASALRDKHIEMATGFLFMKSSTIVKHGPAFTPSFIWKNKGTGNTIEVFVDLCPVIQNNKDLDTVVRSEDCLCKTYYEYVQKVGCIMLMPCNKQMSCKSGMCFKVTLTLAEILLIQDMSEHHRRCYRLMKYILNGIIARTATVFHSYALKTLVLNHHYHKQCTEERNMAKCVMTLILKIHSIVQNSPSSFLRYDMRGHLPNMFLQSVSVWNHEQSITDSDIQIRLQRLLKRLEKISRMEEYSFDKCYIRSVNCSNLNRVYLPIGFILYEALDHIFKKQ